MTIWQRTVARFLHPTPGDQQLDDELTRHAQGRTDLLDRLFGPDDGHPVREPAVPDAEWNQP